MVKMGWLDECWPLLVPSADGGKKSIANIDFAINLTAQCGRAAFCLGGWHRVWRPMSVVCHCPVRTD
jgi:hypothetical protein